MCKPAQIRTLVADTEKEMTAACDDCLSGFPADSLLRFSFSEAERKACIRRYYITAAKLTDLLHHCDAYVAGLSPALEAADAPGRLAQFDEIYRWMEQYWHFREHLISLLAEAERAVSLPPEEFRTAGILKPVSALRQTLAEFVKVLSDSKDCI